MERLILFDIDGTLTRTENGYVPFNEAILQTFGCTGDIRTVVPDGNTDPLIVQDIFAKANFVFEFHDTMWEQFTINLRERYHHHVMQGTTKIRALPGTAALLRALAATENICSSVVTGNFEATAEIKLETAGLAAYLRRGAYASDSHVRADLPAIAKARCERITGSMLLAGQCIIIGDTPNDLQAARQNHMKCILVGTGRYPIEELRYFEPDGCLADLVDTDAVVEVLAKI
jgi:phosphoglycolate phosphatase